MKLDVFWGFGVCFFGQLVYAGGVKMDTYEIGELIGALDNIWFYRTYVSDYEYETENWYRNHPFISFPPPYNMRYNYDYNKSK